MRHKNKLDKNKPADTSATPRNRVLALFFLAAALYKAHEVLDGQYRGWGIGLEIAVIVVLLGFSAGLMSARINMVANRVLSGKRYQTLASVLVPAIIVLVGTLMLVWPEYSPTGDTEAVSGSLDVLSLVWGVTLLFGGVAYAVYELYGMFTRYHLVVLAGGMAFGAFFGLALTGDLPLGTYAWLGRLVMVICAIMLGMLTVTLVIAPRHAKLNAATKSDTHKQADKSRDGKDS